MEKMISSVAKSPPARAAATAQERTIPAPFWIMALVGGLMFCITLLAGPARAADGRTALQIWQSGYPRQW